MSWHYLVYFETIMVPYLLLDASPLMHMAFFCWFKSYLGIIYLHSPFHYIMLWLVLLQLFLVAHSSIFWFGGCNIFWTWVLDLGLWHMIMRFQVELLVIMIPIFIFIDVICLDSRIWYFSCYQCGMSLNMMELEIVWIKGMGYIFHLHKFFAPPRRRSSIVD